jgi:hypothetical protein
MKKDKELYIICYDWITTKYGLSGNEKLMYALIYGMTKNGEYVTLSSTYLTSRIGCNGNTVTNVISSLMAKGLLDKQPIYKGRVKLCQYKALQPDSITPPKNNPLKNWGGSTPKIGGVVPQKLGGYNNNILIDNINTTTTNAHTHDKLQDEIDEMKRDESWQETICMNHKLQLSDLDNLFSQFKIECLCNDKKEHPTITEAKQHFNNWLYKKENRYGNNRRNNPIDNIERAQQQAIAESMELIRKAKERDSQI